MPTRHRNHNGYLLRWDGVGLLFDPGEGTQRQMIHAGVSASQLHHICVTHFHGDHCLGLAGLVQRLSLDGVTQTVRVHYPASGQVYYDRLRHASIFQDKARVLACPIRAPGPLPTDGAFTLTALPLAHTVPAWGYRVDEPAGRRLLPERLDAAGVVGAARARLLRDGAVEVGGRVVTVDEVSAPRPGQAVAVVMDTAVCPNAVELARGVDLLLIESTYLDDDEAEAAERGHLTARQAARIGREAGARRVVLTHFSQKHPDLAPFLAQAGEEHPDVLAVSDGDVVPLPPRRP